MKKVVLNTKMIAVALVTLFAISFTGTAFASDIKKVAAELKYVGNMNEIPVYQLVLTNKTHESFWISVKDSKNNILYTEKVSGVQIVRNFHLLDLPTEDYKITLEVNNSKGEKVDAYDINKTTISLDSIVINKAK